MALALVARNLFVPQPAGSRPVGDIVSLSGTDGPAAVQAAGSRFGFTQMVRANQDMVTASTDPQTAIKAWDSYYMYIQIQASKVWKEAYEEAAGAPTKNFKVENGTANATVPGLGLNQYQAAAIANAVTENFIAGKLALMQVRFPYSFAEHPSGQTMQDTMIKKSPGHQNMMAVRKMIQYQPS